MLHTNFQDMLCYSLFRGFSITWKVRILEAAHFILTLRDNNIGYLLFVIMDIKRLLSERGHQYRKLAVNEVSKIIKIPVEGTIMHNECMGVTERLPPNAEDCSFPA
jgi:hypothetical protein